MTEKERDSIEVRNVVGNLLVDTVLGVVSGLANVSTYSVSTPYSLLLVENYPSLVSCKMSLINLMAQSCSFPIKLVASFVIPRFLLGRTCQVVPPSSHQVLMATGDTAVAGCFITFSPPA